jgi:hypothetical protein
LLSAVILLFLGSMPRLISNKGDSFVVSEIKEKKDQYKFISEDGCYIYRKTKEYSVGDTLWMRK